MPKAILIERETLQHAVLGLLTEGEMAELFENAPILTLLMPLIAVELCKKLFGEEDKE